ncbi:uncharacterized protein NECHADRAFT_82939 [Fusarium vanettenii 77-13-4]|uniref:Uncharacterized protein n=1 Tax=Fusarium vanettenii (strain ATCC MYA-4622 / CBS 123669 / FGSC 9596 / NRRL 45880 / 77-13-4) TaxID=660122 RepID=C7YX96_FUSV7|nr:uncharacterized protein NECHADRAFT_82939 [Fusarium vanettenii 77-13-4]EEU43788.1 hypothetical protein NECHADRAFT_82939 [Fusarium vanettenii 77-13-4]
MRRHLGWRLDMDEEEERFENLEYKDMSVIKLFMPRKLKSFSWEMGTCVPEEILAEKGILGRMHPTIQSLRLITDPECPRGACEPMRLPNFRQLKRLSWTGPNAAYLLELGHLIIKNSQHLQEVEIDLLDWDKVESINGYYDDSDSDGWGTDSDDYWMDSSRNGDKKAGVFACIWNRHMHTTTPRPIFNALTKLSLPHVRVGPGLIGEMNIGLLRSLTLRSCLKWTSFLEYAPKLNVVLKLKELEIEDHYDWPDPPRLSTLWGSLDSFLGLEKLYLSFEELVGILPPCGHISRHRDTLRRLAQYDGAVANILIGDSDDSDEESQRGSEEESQRDSGGKAPSQNLPSNLYLECLGLSCGPEKVPQWINNFGPVSSLKVLHLRPDITDERRFTRPVNEDEHTAADATKNTPQAAVQSTRPAQLLEPFTTLVKWAFGPEGPPSLKFITCGEFAQYGQVDKECFIVGRESERDDVFRLIAPRSRNQQQFGWNSNKGRVA